ncbi:kelch repeat-containing protein [Pyxidicoccus trucidator]|uniref:kelch repeat-containing protein n=1 Tax=Pyxidicoccus trucidator TaxID=2709662 RepID=UPI0013DB00A5|nr:kelch repeat-containing protein [Pyxidicoccus trucidator]
MFRWWPLAVCLALVACAGGEPSVDEPPASDSGTTPAPLPDAGRDAGTDGGTSDAGADGGTSDAGSDAGTDRDEDGGSDGGFDAGSGQDAGSDGGRDAGCGPCESPPPPICWDAKTISTWYGPGVCGTDGGCLYHLFSETCPYGCANGACQPCPRQCDGRQCGDDGCGGSCGECAEPQTCGGGGLPGTCGPVEGCGTWSAGASLQVGRAHPASAVLSDGRIFLAGGLTGSGATRTAEAFDPGTDAWTRQGSIPDGGATPGGASHSFYSYPGAAQLGTGRVLVTGYADNVYALFNPDAGTWTPGSSSLTTRLQPLVLPLASGQALVASGITEGGNYVVRSYTYDDTLAQWNSSTSQEERYRPAAVQLANGRVLVASGIADDVYGQAARSAELYDPVANTWSYTGAPRRSHAGAALARLQDGRVLLIGGTTVRGFFEGSSVRTTSVELYDPDTGRWRDTGFLNLARSGHTATVLADGRVLVAGGVGANGKIIPWVELYDVEQETWTLTAPLSTARSSHVTTQLADGRVLVAGGVSPGGAVLASTEVVQPAGFCPASGCVPESDDALCTRESAGCGTLSVIDACGKPRQVACGQCGLPSTCGGAGVPYRCGVSGSGGWRVETLGTAVGGVRLGIVIEASGEPAVAYAWYDVHGGSDYDVFLARRHSQGWSAAPILSGILAGDVALARTRTGQLRAAARKRVYSSFSSDDVPILLSWDEGRWRDEVAAPNYPAVSAHEVAMGLGPADEPLVCSIDVQDYFHTAELLCYGRDSAGEWKRERVDVPGSYGGPPSVAVDGEGRPHLAYYDTNKKVLVHAMKGASGWTLETVDASADVGRDASLALDAQGRPHIAYRDETNKDLKYAHWTGSAWNLQQVDTPDDVGGTPALALDAQGRPHISYEDVTRDNLKYARWNGTAWEVTTVDASGAGGSDSALAVDASGRAHIVYFGQGLRYARGP